MSNKNNVIQLVKQTRELPDEAYTPESIGSNLVQFFSQKNCTRDEGLDILKGIHELLTTGEHDDQTVHNYVLSFTEHGVTPVELINGLTWVLEEMTALDKEAIARVKGDDDAEKPQLH